jgi:hypothetical protein
MSRLLYWFWLCGNASEPVIYRHTTTIVVVVVVTVRL